MADTATTDKSTFEDVLSEVFGKDMTGWTRVATAFDGDTDAAGSVTRLVLAVDADGNPLPAAGDRPEGYSLGSVMIVSMSHIDFGGVRPQVQINVWDPFTRRLLETGHSTPSMWEMDELTGGDPNWVENPGTVERVLAEFEETLPDAVADALGQLTAAGGIPTAPVDLWADSLGGEGQPPQDPWDDSRGFGDGPPIEELPSDVKSDLPPGVTEAVPWVPDDVHEAEPWVPDQPKDAPPAGESAHADSSNTDTDGPIDWDTFETYPGEREYFEELANAGPPEVSHPIDDIEELDGEVLPPDSAGDTDADVDWENYETYPGEKEFYDNLADAGPPEVSHPIADIENLDEGDLPPETPPPARETTVRWAGTSSNQISTGTTVRVMFTDEHPRVDPSTGQPVAVISGQISTSSGVTAPVRLFLLHYAPGEPALYGSHVLSIGGTGVNHLPASPGDSVRVAVGGRSDTITQVHSHPLELVHAIQKEKLFALGVLVAEMRRGYFAATEDRMDDAVVAFNRQRFDESLRTIQLGIEHADDPGVLKEQVARTQYYLDHTIIDRISLRRLAEGKTMVDPYHDDIRRVTTLKHGQSMLSFYQNDVVIHEHFTTLVEDAQAYGEFMRSEAVGKHFDKIAISMLQASYDPLVDKTPMAWLYPILSYAVTGKFTDHHGQTLSSGAVAALGIDVILKSVDFSKNQLAKTGRYTPGRAEMDYGEAVMIDEITEAITGKGMDGAASLAGAGIGAAVDHQQAVADAAARGTDATPTPVPTPTPTPVSAPDGTEETKATQLSTGVKVGIGAVAAAVIIAGGAYLLGNGGDETSAAATTSQPAADAQLDPGPPAENPTDEPVADDGVGDGAGDPPPQTDADEVLEDELFEIPVPERDAGSLDAPTSDGLTAQEILLLPPPDPTTTDDEQRRGGGSLYVDATYAVDWQADIVVNNGRITPGGLFPAGSGWRGEYLILADCSVEPCVYSTPLAHGDTVVFTQQGLTIFGTSNDLSGGCNRDIFVAFRVSDFQTINGRLVPDAIHGARIETGTCETPVYREIIYEGGFEFVGSYNDR